MSSHTVSSRFDECLARNGASLLRLTFLLSREKGAAEELAFQSLLRLAARPEADAGDDRSSSFPRRCASVWTGFPASCAKSRNWKRCGRPPSPLP